MKKLLIAPALFLALMLLSGCVMMQPYQTDYPAIETGIYLTQIQMDLQKQYVEMYEFVSEEDQAKMEREIAPMLNNLKHRIHAYNVAIDEGTLPPHSEDELRMLARRISMKIFEVMP